MFFGLKMINLKYLFFGDESIFNVHSSDDNRFLRKRTGKIEIKTLLRKQGVCSKQRTWLSLRKYSCAIGKETPYFFLLTRDFSCIDIHLYSAYINIYSCNDSTPRSKSCPYNSVWLTICSNKYNRGICRQWPYVNCIYLDPVEVLVIQYLQTKCRNSTINEEIW